MQKQSRLPLLAIASSILLPYGIVTTGTGIMTTNQYWLFPLWTYAHDFGNWLGLGIIIPPFLPSFSLLPPFVGLIWCVLALYISIILNQFNASQRDAKSVWFPTLVLLILQILVTMIVGFIVWTGWPLFIIPLPLHFLIVLLLVRIQIQKVSHE